MKLLMVLMMALASLLTMAAEKSVDARKLDKNMAIVKTQTDADTVWIDSKDLPMEGNAYWPASGTQFVRLPPEAETNVELNVWKLSHHTAGMQFRFTTDSKYIHLKWKARGGLVGPTIDVYRWKESYGWRFVHCKIYLGPDKNGVNEDKFAWVPGAPCLLNLPHYSVVDSLQVGISKGAKIWAAPVRKSGIDKPVVFYGTSITQGAWGSRPGMTFVNIIGRKLDVPVVNLGFSGNGNMALSMVPYVAGIDASCYVIDTAHNTGTKFYNPGERSETFIRELRKCRPETPIIICETTDSCQYSGTRQFADRDQKIRAMYERLCSDGITGLSYVPAEIQYAPDDEGTMDTSHPGDWGMMHIAYAYGDAIADVLKLPRMPRYQVGEHTPYGK